MEEVNTNPNPSNPPPLANLPTRPIPLLRPHPPLGRRASSTLERRTVPDLLDLLSPLKEGLTAAALLLLLRR